MQKHIHTRTHSDISAYCLTDTHTCVYPYKQTPDSSNRKNMRNEFNSKHFVFFVRTNFYSFPIKVVMAGVVVVASVVVFYRKFYNGKCYFIFY